MDTSGASKILKIMIEFRIHFLIIPQMGKATPNGNQSVPALEKGLAALECVHSSASALSLTEISRACGRSVSKMQRVVPFLAERGFFVRDERGLYRASSKLFRLANRHHPYRNITAIALPAMRDFTEATGESVHLSILESGSPIIVADVPGTGDLRLSASIGIRIDPQVSTSGRVLLAFAEGAKSAEAHRIVKAGFEFAPSHLYRGVKDLAVPVTLPGGQVIAALATTWVDPIKSTLPQEKRLLPELQRCAARIAASIEPTPLSQPPNPPF
jgi:DNA-binding IclR family transcriptional regulator